MNKVVGGTPLIHSISRCTTCRFAHMLNGMAVSDTRVYCRMLGQQQPVQVRQPVYECNQYDDKRLPSRYDMEQIAWVLVTNKLGRAIGFVSAEEFRKYPGSPPLQSPVGF